MLVQIVKVEMSVSVGQIRNLRIVYQILSIILCYISQYKLIPVIIGNKQLRMLVTQCVQYWNTCKFKLWGLTPSLVLLIFADTVKNI